MGTRVTRGEWVQVLAVSVLALVHIAAPWLRLVSALPRSMWLSFGGGVSVAYVFVHLLPEVARGQRAVADDVPTALHAVEDHVWLVALAGLVAFYGVEHASSRSRDRRRRAGGDDRAEARVFWVSTAAFALLNVVVGYLVVHREPRSTGALLLFTAALAVHFLVADAGLMRHHGVDHHRWGRWILVASVLAGFAIGLLTSIGEEALAVLVAFLAGGIVLNVLKDEVPGDRQARFLPFLLGAVGYSALLLAA